LVMTMLLCFALLAVVGVTHAVPEIAADGDDLVLSVTGDGSVSIQYPFGKPQLIATEVDTKTLETMIVDLLAEQKGQWMAAQEQMQKEMNARMAALETALGESNKQRDALVTQMENLQGAVEVATASLDDAEQCQSSLVDAVHDGSVEIPGCPASQFKGGCAVYPKVENGDAIGHGERKGSIRFVHCNDGYQLEGAVSRIVVCSSEGEWSDSTKARCVGTTSTTTTATTITTTTTVKEEWTLIFRQKKCKWTVDGPKDVGKADTDDCFARWSQITTNGKNNDGKFVFKLLYPNDDSNDELIFEQDTNPLTSRSEIESGQPGFKVISTGNDPESAWNHDYGFNGFAAYPNQNAVLAAGHGYWYALGSPGACFPGNFNSWKDEGTRCKDPVGRWNADWAELYVKTN